MSLKRRSIIALRMTVFIAACVLIFWLSHYWVTGVVALSTDLVVSVTDPETGATIWHIATIDLTNAVPRWLDGLVGTALWVPATCLLLTSCLPQVRPSNQDSPRPFYFFFWFSLCLGFIYAAAILAGAVPANGLFAAGLPLVLFVLNNEKFSTKQQQEQIQLGSLLGMISGITGPAMIMVGSMHGLYLTSALVIGLLVWLIFFAILYGLALSLVWVIVTSWRYLIAEDVNETVTTTLINS